MLSIQADDARAVALGAAIKGGDAETLQRRLRDNPDLACRGGQQPTAEDLLDRGADLNWVGHDGKTPCDVSQECGDDNLIQWLRARGAKRAAELK